ncbi:hypothetical protein Pryu01_01065 [Paraliobacillus ryukyuensis]|uniref:Uncharacterized protein n=1 Tax=Paraliobacillus ryukyuensis TaxID=200904 RepID=A0A366EDH1_9BACI|nr:Rha family transcriptional regulator [Paraliobacillus ryukyuensis]RBP00363.1 hypothetical protein DES48_102124 [Paraliobacillus ryukyuensis]
MSDNRKATPFGWEVKRKLAELQLDQRSFCKQYNIPEARLSELITGKRPVKRYREMVEFVLNINQHTDEKKMINGR